MLRWEVTLALSNVNPQNYNGLTHSLNFTLLYAMVFRFRYTFKDISDLLFGVYYTTILVDNNRDIPLINDKDKKVTP